MNPKKYWLRGLLTGLALAVLLQIGNVFGGLGCMGFYNGVDASFVSDIICTPLMYVVNVVGPIAIFPLWLILGAVIGWIYGKIKNRQGDTVPKSRGYWLRGGFIIGGAVLLYVVPAVLLMLFTSANYDPIETYAKTFSEHFITPFLFLLMAVSILLSPLSVLVAPKVYILCVAVILIFGGFIIGAILGWLYGKIKNRNSVAV